MMLMTIVGLLVLLVALHGWMLYLIWKLQDAALPQSIFQRGIGRALIRERFAVRLKAQLDAREAAKKVGGDGV